MNGDLVLFEHSVYGGYRICFYGSGLANLGDYYFGWTPFRSWHDKMSSFISGCSTGTLYEHSNRGGAAFDFGRWTSYPQMSSFWNDRVSSVWLTTWCS